MIAVESVVSFWAVKMEAKRLNTLWYNNVMLRMFLYLISTFFLFRLVVLLSFLICSQRMRKKMKNLLKKTVLRKQLPLYDGFKHLMYSCMRYHISPCPALNSGEVPFCVQDSSLRYCVERSWDWQNYVHSSLGLVTDNLRFLRERCFFCH